MSNKPAIPDSIDSERLQAMRLVAKMKEAADKAGIGFVGGFSDGKGDTFTMTNMGDDDAEFLLPDDLKN